MNSTDLKIKRETLIDKVEAFDALATEEKRSLTEGESKSVQDIYSEIEKLDGEIKLAEKIEATKAERAAIGAKASTSEEKEKAKIAKRVDIRNVFTHLRTGKALEGAEAEIHEMGQTELRDFHKSGKGFVFPSFMVNPEKRTDIDQATSAIAPVAVSDYVYSLRENSIIQQVGVNFMNLTADYKIPIVGANSLAWATAENSAAADGGANFTSDTLTPFRLTGYVDISNEILIQNGQGALAAVMADLGRETANKIDAAIFSTASVTNAPPSLGAKSGIGTFTETASYSANASILADLVLAEQTLADAEGLTGNLRYVTSTKLLADLKKSAQVASVTPAMTGATGTQVVNGYPIYFTTTCTNATSTADGYFGNWDGMKAGFFGGMDMVLDPYSVLLNDKVRVVVHRHMDWGFPVAANFVKFTSLTA